MSGTNAFCWLDGTVTICSRAPAAWAREGLHEFYRNPNSTEWGDELCRVLYHESIHFWQLLSSAYLANAVQDEWLRYREFERSASLTGPTEFVRGMTARHPGAAFSVHELMECWARYWDVHTRSPARIIEEDEIPVPSGCTTRTRRGEIVGYTSEAFDLFMLAGKDAHLYAAPYRWVLQRSNGHSALANVLFPILTFHAFGSPDPIAFLEESLGRALGSDLILTGLDKRSGNINLDWLNNWGVVLDEAIDPARRKLGMPDFTGGWDVIARGPLGTHPIYRSYSRQVAAMFGVVTLSAANVMRPTSPDWVAAYKFAVLHLAGRDPRVIFAFPGQPEYRTVLGQWLPPPRVKFEGMTIHANDRIGGLNAKLHEQLGAEISADDHTGACVYSNLDAGMRRFRRADYAISIGLSADTFD